MIKVIALTMHIGNKDESLTAGTDDHLLKGFEAEILHKKMLRILDGSVLNSPAGRGIGRRSKRRSSMYKEQSPGETRGLVS